MYYDVLIDGNSYGLMDHSDVHVEIRREENSLSFLDGKFAVPSRFDRTLEFNLPFGHHLQNLLIEKQEEVYSRPNSFNYKFDISLQMYQPMDDFYAFDYGDILIGENSLKGCFVEEINFTDETCKAKLRFDYFETTNYF